MSILGGDAILSRIKNTIHVFIVFIFAFLFFSPIVTSAEKQPIEEINYVALGDSLAEGYLAYPEEGSNIGDGYPVFIQQGIEEEHDLTVNITNAGVGGYRTDNVYDDLIENVDEVMDSVEGADLITLGAGANDVIQEVGIEKIATFDPNNTEEVEEMTATAREAIEEVKSHTEEILKVIESENQSANIYVLGYYNALPHFSEGQQEVIVAMIHELNEAIENVTEEHGETFIPTFDSIAEKNTEYLPNPIDIHPTEEGYQVIADLFLDNILPTIDVVPPEITLLGDNPIELMQGETFTDPGVEAIDDMDGDLTESVEITEDIDMNVPGEYEVNYEVADSSGNITTETRKVVVLEDDEAPVITLNDDKPIELEVGETYEEPGATAEDNVDGDITDDIEITGEVNTNKVGDYTITYTVSDAAGNETVKERQIKIISAEKKDPKPENESDDLNNQNTNNGEANKDNDDKHHYKNGSDSSGKDLNEPIKGKDTSSLANNKGDMLPHTASTMPLFILIGILLTATGGLIFVIQKRLSKKKAIQNPN